jgi:hypothetical protein
MGIFTLSEKFIILEGNFDLLDLVYRFVKKIFIFDWLQPTLAPSQINQMQKKSNFQDCCVR